MTQTDILKELEQFTITERLSILETAMRLIREDLQQEEQSQFREGRKHQLVKAAEMLREDYATDRELTVFTVLDSEEFYA